MNIYTKAVLDVSTVKRWVSKINVSPLEKGKTVQSPVIKRAEKLPTQGEGNCCTFLNRIVTGEDPWIHHSVNQKKSIERSLWQAYSTRKVMDSCSMAPHYQF